MAGVTSADVVATWKERYIRPVVEFLGYEGNAGYATMKKRENIGGVDQKLPVIVSPPQGESASIASAIANQTAGDQEAFIITPVERFGVITITGQALARSEGNENAFLTAKVLQMDGIIRQLGRSANINLFRDGSGVIGMISQDTTLNPDTNRSTFYLGTSPVNGVATAGTQVGPTTIVSGFDVVNFEKTMAVNLVYWTNGVGWQYRNPSGSTANKAFVINVDTGAQTLTFGASSTATVGTNLSTLIPAAQLGDCIVRDGDFGGNGVAGGTGNVSQGFGSWNPWQAPTSTTEPSFFGMPRYDFPNRKAGQRLVMPGADLTSVIMAGCSLANNQSARIDTIWMNYRNYNLLLNQLEGKRTYDDDIEIGARGAEGEVAGISFMGVRINIPGAKCNVMFDNCCPDQVIYFQESNDWEFQSVGPFPRDLMPGLEGGLPLDNDNAFQWRRGGYIQLANYNPAHQVVAVVH